MNQTTTYAAEVLHGCWTCQEAAADAQYPTIMMLHGVPLSFKSGVVRLLKKKGIIEKVDGFEATTYRLTEFGRTIRRGEELSVLL